MSKKTIYLDYAAATPLDDEVFRVMQPYGADFFYNPSAPYQPAREVRSDIEAARAAVARTLGAKPTEIIFTAGATESINLAFTIGGHVVASKVEHAAVISTAEKYDHSFVGVGKNGLIKLTELEKLIRDDTTLISIGLVNNETGTLQPLGDVVKIIEKVRAKRAKKNISTPLFLHTDASQAGGVLDLNVARLGVDLLTLNGAKMYGPKQTAILYVSSSVNLHPIVYGGGQERGLRSGTENVAGIIGFAKALEIAQNKRKTEVERLHGLRQQMIDILQSEFDDILILDNPKHQAPHILTIAWHGLDAERALFALESDNILVATGSACAANKDSRSHVLVALGLKPDIIDGSLRLSFGRQTTNKEIEQAGKIISMIVKRELKRGK